MNIQPGFSLTNYCLVHDTNVAVIVLALHMARMIARSQGAIATANCIKNCHKMALYLAMMG